MEEEKEDRISSLPDGLLLDIISLIKINERYYDGEEERIMTTKEVIKTTSTISKRWKHLWTKLPNLIFTDVSENEVRKFSENQTDYFSFIDKTLTQCPTHVNLNKFKLHIHYSSRVDTRPTSQINSWFRYAITRNVQEFNFWFLDSYYSYRGVPKEFSFDDELFFNNSCFTRMKLSCCIFNPPNRAIRWDNLKYLRISKGKLDDDSLGKMSSGSPCLETLELDDCYGVRRIDLTSKRFKNLVLSGYGSEFRHPIRADYINTIDINAPYMLSLTIKYKLYLEKLLLLNVSSLVKADLDYQGSWHFSADLGLTREDIEEELLRGHLTSLGHVNEISLGDNCLEVLYRLKLKGFQLFKVGADADEDRITELLAPREKKLASLRSAGASTVYDDFYLEDILGFSLFD